jgi:tRNA-specific 2-thiouridylase
MKPSVAVAVSGGVDSLMAAYLLKNQGYTVVGFHFLTGYETVQRNVESIADQLNIPIHIIDLSEVFESKIVQYFIDTYLQCKTPNPCLICNPSIKFGILLDEAIKRGIDRLATGHYARIVKAAQNSERVHLLKGIDKRKDQSYFLALLTQGQLSRAIFPLGNFAKETVKKMAVEKGLKPITQEESQDICFIKESSYSQFMDKYSQIKNKPGDIVDTAGHVLGHHDGLHLFTIGQRRGINCPASEPYYVLRLNPMNNQLVVGHKDDTLSQECQVEKINWIQPSPSDPIRVHCRVRYRHDAATSVLTPLSSTKAIVRFDTPQASMAPGQGAVFYIGEELIGGGIIN